jgi:hypothetical protein
MATTTKSARLSDAEVEFLTKLLPHFPEYRSEAQLLHTATMLGLWMLAAGARRPGYAAYGGYVAEDLAALLQPRMLAALEFLGARQVYPVLASVEERVEGAFVGAVAEDMAELGAELMD